MSQQQVVIVGGGCFGASAAIELLHRGYRVVIVDELRDAATATTASGSDVAQPHELASSTDDNKLIRPDYGDDAFYTDLMRRAMEQRAGEHGYLPGWRSWNDFFGEAEPMYHQTGLLLLDRRPWSTGASNEAPTFGEASYKTVQTYGMRVERVRQAELRSRYRGWNAERYVEGYINHDAGWADSGRVVAALLRRAAALGATFHRSMVTRLVYDHEATERRTRVLGVETRDGRRVLGDHVVVAAGAWTPSLVPSVRGFMWPSGQVVCHFAPPDDECRALFDGASGAFPAWCAAIKETGFYGFPVHPRTGWLKVGHHGVGFPLRDIEPRRDVLERLLARARATEERRFRAFVADTFPELARGATAFMRVCLYCDTASSDFLIDREPSIAGLTVAAGCSGHAFKFTPVLGAIIADALEGTSLERFSWRAAVKTSAYDSCRRVDADQLQHNQAIVQQAIADCTSTTSTQAKL